MLNQATVSSSLKNKWLNLLALTRLGIQIVSVKIKVFLVKINIFNISTYKHKELSVGGEISREAEVGFYNFEKKA